MPVRMLCYADRFIEHGPQDVLWRAAGIDADGIARSVLDLLHPDQTQLPG